MKTIMLKAVGSISLTLGVLGAFLPLLPSTCFILCSAWAFSKSSPRFHAWLLFQSPFAESIQNWQQNKSVPIRVKVIATISLMSSFLMTLWLIPNPMFLTVLGTGMIVLLVYLLTRPGVAAISVNTSSSCNPELRLRAN